MSLSEFDTRSSLTLDIKIPGYVDNEILRNLSKRLRILANIDYTFGRIFFRHA